MARTRYFEDEEQVEVQRGSFRRLIAYLKPHTGIVAVSLGLVLIAAIAAQIGPYLVKTAVDEYLPKGDLLGIVRLALIYVGVLLASAVASRYKVLFMVRTGNTVIETLREEAFRHTNSLSFKFFDDRPAGKIIVRLMNNVDRLQQMVKHGVINVIADVFRLVIILGFMLSISPRLTLIAMLITPVLGAFIFVIKSRITKRWEEFHKKNANLNAYTHESFIGIKVTQAFVQEENNSQIMKEQLDDNYDTWMRATRISTVLFPAVLIFNTLSIGLVYFLGYRYLGMGLVSLGTLIAFGQYVWMITEPIVNLSTFYNEILVALAAAERVFQILDTEPEVVNAPDAYELPPVEGRVEFHDIHFAYEEGLPVFHGLSFAVEPGETIALVGETGAGKSTVINLISRFYDIQSGSILVDSHDVRRVTLESLRGQVGVMMQDSFIFSGTVADNIRYGRLDATRDEVVRAAEAVHADEFIRKLEQGYDTEVNERGNRLSVGQKQLVAFARTLLYDPRILILDEATASIDTQTELLLQQAIERVLRDRTSFVIAHRLSTIRNADRILVIEAGEIIESGTHEELLGAGGKYTELHHSQYAQVV
jgi:ATP-binding cassette subfamily B multidrug efflux pump